MWHLLPVLEACPRFPLKNIPLDGAGGTFTSFQINHVVSLEIAILEKMRSIVFSCTHVFFFELLY